jgi:hypothetical protein
MPNKLHNLLPVPRTRCYVLVLPGQHGNVLPPAFSFIFALGCLAPGKGCAVWVSLACAMHERRAPLFSRPACGPAVLISPSCADSSPAAAACLAACFSPRFTCMRPVFCRVSSCHWSFPILPKHDVDHFTCMRPVFCRVSSCHWSFPILSMHHVDHLPSTTFA